MKERTRASRKRKSLRMLSDTGGWVGESVPGTTAPTFPVDRTLSYVTLSEVGPITGWDYRSQQHARGRCKVPGRRLCQPGRDAGQKVAPYHPRSSALKLVLFTVGKRPGYSYVAMRGGL